MLLFVAATLLIAISPGPNTFFVISQALTAGRTRTMLAIAGLATSSVVYLTATVTGLATLMHAWPLVFKAIQLAGVAYLVYLGVRMIGSDGAVRSDPAVAVAAPGRSPVLQGFVTSFSNPKAILYWSAFLPQFIDHARPIAPQLILLGVIGPLIEVVVLAGYAFVVLRSRQRLVTPRFARTTHRIAGLYFVGLGVYFGALLTLRRG